MTIENCGNQFNLELYLEAREKTIHAVKACASQILPGMNEADCIAILNCELERAGALKFWHPTKFRINTNTTKSFRDKSEEAILENTDLFFIDIGPVIHDHEGDYGETFVIGNDPKLLHLQMATKKIFQETRHAWKENNLTGHELYEFAQKEAEKLHLKLNTAMYGHRLGDFPHALYYKGKLGELNISVSPYLWVLEIHVIDESINRGAFFEDILI